ncbi:WhiB family transcriptional regulator [Prauserella muralis]|uniref:WhiB family transcriptional regulator n=1 Tax=Prauserella muralis TaxID=588067 RepID=UPI000DD31EB7|nr:WhiB family transcriptional regulator [Prauserella muralis]TWE24245.1 WhiB family redox-sensing transcriptional regulator [Prauserella muralis]
MPAPRHRHPHLGIAGRNPLARTRQPVVSWADFGLTADDLAWHEHAACRDTDPDAFFPERDPDIRANIATARRICQHCPVRRDCLDYALAHPDVEGIWGGLTTRERRQLPAPVQPHRPRTHARDREIARLTRAGLTATEVATRLAISPRTVERARQRLEEVA